MKYSVSLVTCYRVSDYIPHGSLNIIFVLMVRSADEGNGWICLNVLDFAERT